MSTKCSYTMFLRACISSEASTFTRLCSACNSEIPLTLMGNIDLCNIEMIKIDLYGVSGCADTAPRYLRFASALTGWDHPLLRYKLSALISAQGAAAEAYTLLQVRAPSSTSHSAQTESLEAERD